MVHTPEEYKTTIIWKHKGTACIYYLFKILIDQMVWE